MWCDVMRCDVTWCDMMWCGVLSGGVCSSLSLRTRCAVCVSFCLYCFYFTLFNRIDRFDSFCCHYLVCTNGSECPRIVAVSLSLSLSLFFSSLFTLSFDTVQYITFIKRFHLTMRCVVCTELFYFIISLPSFLPSLLPSFIVVLFSFLPFTPYYFSWQRLLFLFF